MPEAVPPTALIQTVVLWSLVGVAALWDISWRRIPNPLILTGLLLGLAFQTQAGGITGLGSGVLGAAFALAVLIGPFALRVMGGGDVKLAMVVGAFLGWKGAAHILLVGTVVHGLISLGVVLWRRFRAMRGLPPGEQRGIPHAVGFALATWMYGMGIGVMF